MGIEQSAEEIASGPGCGEDDEPRRRGRTSGMDQLRLHDALEHRPESLHDAEVGRIDQVEGTIIRRCDDVSALGANGADAVARDRAASDALGFEVELDQLAPVVAHDDGSFVEETHRLGRAAAQRDRVGHPSVGEAIDLESEVARNARQVGSAGIDGDIVDDGHVAEVTVVKAAVERPRDQGTVGTATGGERLAADGCAEP